MVLLSNPTHSNWLAKIRGDLKSFMNLTELALYE